MSSDSSEDSMNSDERYFEKEHGIKLIDNPHETKDKIVVRVKDSGVGIKSKDRIKLFKLFGKL